ncbi:MAG TPA: isoprenylcysteine carboxylmethyltransferase family protein [Solirubrobacterales bacterium]|jgi:protein-S-isoprenylcysteine O-methyltransferase Ste14
MNSLKIAIVAFWIAFWIYWGISALAAKQGTSGARGTPMRALILLVLVVLFRVVHAGSLDVHGVVLPILGTVLVVGGLGFAVWARVHLGRNWGMPMTQKEEPELITSGPYRFVRHPIYTGILTAVLGTALAVNLLALAVAAIAGAYFWHSATVEERNLTAIFPRAYPAYKARTKMLIPFVL